MAWSNELTIEFLHLYEAEDCIWNPRHSLHKNRNAVSDAWKRIQENFSLEVTVNELKRKKESLMATFRTIMQKWKASQKCGSSIDNNVFKPNWFAFDTMFKFLEKIYQPKPPLKEDIENMDEEVSVPMDHLQKMDYNKDSATMKEKATTHSTKKRRTTNNFESFTTVSNNTRENEKDLCSMYCDLLAIKLRCFDEENQDKLMNEIDNLVFHAKQSANRYNVIKHSLSIDSSSSSHSFIQ